MSDIRSNFVDPAKVQAYLASGPAAFAPGHAGLLQMIGVLLDERVPRDGVVLIVGAGGGLEARYLASVSQSWHFVGVDPSPVMLDLARATAGATAGGRLHLIEGTVTDAPSGPYDAATCLLVLGLIADDGSKLATLEAVRGRLKPGAPFILVDQCIDRSAPDAETRLDRYAAYARRSGVAADVAAHARDQVAKLDSMVPASRNERLLHDAGFADVEVFYVGMAWRGWVAYAGD